MDELKSRTLVTLVQVMDRAIRDLELQLETASEVELPDLQELLLEYSLAASDLQAMYLRMKSPDDNLPTYEELVARH